MNNFINNIIDAIISNIEMVAVTSLLPLAALLAVFLRRDMLGVRFKVPLLIIGLLLVLYTIFNDLQEYMEEIRILDTILIASVALVTYVVMSFAHKHNEDNQNVKAAVLAEFIHSLIDGVVIGMAYLVNPIIGWGTALAVITHELPKILGTIVLIRSLTNNMWDTIKYSAICQAGVPLASMLIYTFGINIDEKWRHTVELMAIITLLVIIIKIAIHSWRHRGCKH